MRKNVFHLIAAVATTAFFAWEIAVLAFFLHDTKNTVMFKHYIWVVPIVLYVVAIAAGVLQYVKELDNSRRYAAWLTIFASFAFFPIIVSLVMFDRSGLSKKQQEIGIKKWYIDHIVELRIAIENEPQVMKRISKETWRKVFLVRELQNEGFLDTYNGNAYKFELLTREVPQKDLPKIYDMDEIVSVEKDLPMTKKKA